MTSKHLKIIIRNYLSPFAKRKNETYRKGKSLGGKPDDITVVVAQIELQTETNTVHSSSSIAISKPKVEDLVGSGSNL
jgi:hypothetical protein